jgi:hypothetical protein
MRCSSLTLYSLAVAGRADDTDHASHPALVNAATPATTEATGPSPGRVNAMNIDPAATDIEPTTAPSPATSIGFRSAAAVQAAAVRNGSKYQETTSARRSGESMKPSASALRASANAERRA